MPVDSHFWTTVPLMAISKSWEAFRNRPLAVSAANVRAGSAELPLAKGRGASIAPRPLLSRLEVSSAPMSERELFAQVLVMVVWVTTGLPAGRL
jgi:hypothetical protein